MAGKRSGQSLMAIRHSGQCQSCLFFVQDCLSGHRFLVNTGAEVSIVPSTYVDRRQSVTSALQQVANGSVMSTLGPRSHTLDLGLRWTFRWIFTVAFVVHPIFALEFLSFFNLSVHELHCRLIDKSTLLTVNGIRSHEPSLGIQAL